MLLLWHSMLTVKMKLKVRYIDVKFILYIQVGLISFQNKQFLFYNIKLK